MPHGQRDWGNIGAETIVHGLDDQAELAARLWSPNTFNREGSVLFMDGFETGLSAWSTYTTGGGNYVRTSREWWVTNGYSCKMYTTGSAPTLSKIQRYFPYPVSGKYGFEAAIATDQYLDILTYQVLVYDGTYQNKYLVRFDYDNDVIQVWNVDTWVDIADPAKWHVMGLGMYNQIKMVFDIDSEYYERLIVNGDEYNLRVYQPQQSANVAAPYMDLTIQVEGADGQNSESYVDNVIITMNET